VTRAVQMSANVSGLPFRPTGFEIGKNNSDVHDSTFNI
jgi:hypothetical protein